MIVKLRHFVPGNTILKIYQSLIHPYISYGLTAWGLASKAYPNKILVLQKRALRFIFFTNKREHVVPLFVQTNILPLDFLYYQSLYCLMQDIFNQKAPSNILKMFTETGCIHSYNTRSSTSKNFYIKASRLEIRFSKKCLFKSRAKGLEWDTNIIEAVTQKDVHYL